MRSMSFPTIGLAKAIVKAPIDRESEIDPRDKPMLAPSGFMKIPTFISTTDVEQHIVPSAAKKAIRQAARRVIRSVEVSLHCSDVGVHDDHPRLMIPPAMPFDVN